MRRILYIFFLIPGTLLAQQLFIPSDGLVHISEGANLEIGGDLENNGAVQNLGTLTLYGDWTSNNNFNGLQGALRFWGGADQVVGTELAVSELVINQVGEVNLTGSDYLILDRIDFQLGNIKPGEDTRFVLGPNVRVNGGSNMSYFDGTLVSQGSGIKTFPVGSDGVHAPVTLLSVFGLNTEIAASFQRGNPADPVPGDSLIGVSHRGLWELEVVNGNTDPTKIELGFNEEDLSDFRIRNNIRHKVNSPVITYASDPAGVFEPLGVESLLNSDSLTFGTILSEDEITLGENQKVYLAMGLAPRIPNEGLFFIPEAFSPQASDSRNNRFKVFGQNISEEGFSLLVYNRYGSLVYSSDSFIESNQVGWNGENQRTGVEEPAGVFYYTIKFQFVTGLPVEKKGAFFLVR